MTAQFILVSPLSNIYPSLSLMRPHNIQMHTPSKETTAKAQLEATGVLYLRRICQQIEQEVESLLSTMSTSNIPELTQRSVQKYILTFKQAIARSISAHMPHVLQLTDRLSQKDQQLQILRLSMKSEIENEVQGRMLAQNRSRVEYGIQAVDPAFLLMEQDDYNFMLQKISQQKEEKELYHVELSKHFSQINELKQSLSIADKRIEQLQIQYQDIKFATEADEEANKLLKEEVGEVLMKLEEEQSLRQKAEMECKQKQMRIEELQQNVDQCNVLMDNLKRQNQVLQNEVKHVQKDNNQKQKELQSQLRTCESKIASLQREIADRDNEIVSLRRETQKIGFLSQSKAELESKFNQKFNLLSKHNRELSDKNKHLKSENERLYTAMQQYAGEQIKLKKKLDQAQFQLKSADETLDAYQNLKACLRATLGKIQRELISLRKQCKGEWLHRGVAQKMEQLREMEKQMCERISNKLQGVFGGYQRLEGEMQEKIKFLTQDYRALQQKCLESQINSGKVAGSLLEAKREVSHQLIQKDEIIRSLESELARERDINEASMQKLAAVVGRFERHQRLEAAPEADNNYDRELERRLESQKIRFQHLQKQYQQMLES